MYKNMDITPVICKMIGIRRYSSLDLTYGRKPKHSEVCGITDKTLIKPTITDMISNQGYNNILVNYMGEMFICERNRNAITVYTKKALKYHPLQNQVAI
jgi:hypothetical protein